MRFVKARLTASFLHEFVIYTSKPKNTITFHIIIYNSKSQIRVEFTTQFQL